mmetsp:Transcript_20552/g.38233  ORF Transcript_20552/g.38233 Transcript_20552/m.38233 type:complete len:254 (+) Transcript_20552:43-804(+)
MLGMQSLRSLRGVAAVSAGGARPARWAAAHVRWLSEEKGGLDPEIVAARKAQLEAAEKAREEHERYFREREAYQNELKALRKRFAKEHDALQTQIEKEREEAAQRAVQVANERRKLQKAKIEKMYSQRTVLEVKAQGPGNTAEEREAEKELKRQEKMKRRMLVLENLKKEQQRREKRYEVELEYLAREASTWISKADLDNGEIENKVAAKLVTIQPITATWANALPKQHFEGAHKFLSNEGPRLEDLLHGTDE